MKRLLTILVGILLCTVWACASELDPDQKNAAIAAANDWLLMVDAQDYEGSWHHSADFLKASVAKDQWMQTMEQVRKPVGNLVSRKVSKTEYRTMLPKALKGQYVIIEFATSFSSRPSAVENITQMLEKDGSWRVGGYHLK